MTKPKKEMTAPLSSKNKLLENKGLLPQDPKKTEKSPIGPATDKKETILPEKQPDRPIGLQDGKPANKLEVLESSGLARA